MASDSTLFADSLISPDVQKSLPDGYKLRPLQRTDFKDGHLDVLRDLAYVGELSEKEWTGQYDFMSSCKGSYYVVVIVDQNREVGRQVVGTGTLMVERKFLYKLGIQGHIEDIAIKKDQQGKKFGIKLLAALDYVAEHVGCYKTILDCSPENEGFYVKCGYEKAGTEMHRYYDPEAQERGI